MLPTVHEYLAARGPSSGCLGLGGCFAVGQSVFLLQTVQHSGAHNNERSGLRPEIQFTGFASSIYYGRLVFNFKTCRLIFGVTSATKAPTATTGTHDGRFHSRPLTMESIEVREAKRAKPSRPPLPDELRELARAPWTADGMPTDCFDGTFTVELMMPEESITALETCFQVANDGTLKQNYCHSISEFVRNVLYRRFETPEQFFSKAKEEGKKLSKAFGDIIAHSFGEMYRSYVNMGDGPSNDSEVLVLMNWATPPCVKATQKDASLLEWLCRIDPNNCCVRWYKYVLVKQIKWNHSWKELCWKLVSVVDYSWFIPTEKVLYQNQLRRVWKVLSDTNNISEGMALFSLPTYLRIAVHVRGYNMRTGDPLSVIPATAEGTRRMNIKPGSASSRVSYKALNFHGQLWGIQGALSIQSEGKIQSAEMSLCEGLVLVARDMPSKLKVLFLDEWANNNYTPEQKEALRKSMLERLARGRETQARGGYQALARGRETQASGGYQALARGRATRTAAFAAVRNSINEEDIDFEGVIVGATDEQREMVEKQLRGLRKNSLAKAKQRIEKLTNFFINHSNQLQFNSQYELVLREDDGKECMIDKEFFEKRLQTNGKHYAQFLSMCLLEKDIDVSHMNSSKGTKVAFEMKRVAMFIVFARLNIKAGELKLGPNGHIKYQNEEISKESMAELGVLRGSVHYAELVRTLMAEFGVDLEDKTGTVAAKKAAKTQIEAHKKAHGKLCHDFVNGCCILCNANTQVASVTSLKLDTKPAAKDLTKSQCPKHASIVFSKPDSKLRVETSITLTKSRDPLQRIDTNSTSVKTENDTKLSTKESTDDTDDVLLLAML